MGSRVDIYSVKLVKDSGKVYQTDTTIRSPRDAARVINEVIDLQHMPNERFVMMSLNIKNKVVGVHTIHMGTVNSSIVHPRDIFSRAVLNNAASIMVFHNHPSGDISPSSEDRAVTERLIKAGEIMGIELMDHIIVAEGDQYYSFQEKDVIFD